MDGVLLKKTLAEGGLVFGCMFSAMGTTRFRGALAGSTLDYVVIDSEHGSRDRKEIQELCRMLRDLDMAPIVRIPVPMAHWVAMALDAGAAGVLVPYCETVAEVTECVATAKWHPLKGEYLRRAQAEGRFPSERSREYLAARHADSIVVIGIESEPAVERLPEILAVGDIDGIFVGPNDMTTSLGIPDEVTHPRYLEVLEARDRHLGGGGRAGHDPPADRRHVDHGDRAGGPLRPPQLRRPLHADGDAGAVRGPARGGEPRARLRPPGSGRGHGRDRLRLAAPGTVPARR